MSFWDSIKPAKKAPVAVTVAVAPDQQSLLVTWDDGHIATLTGQRLRQSCPCAECVEEFTGKKVLDDSKIGPEMKLLEVSPVGNYAITFVFGDAHRTGIFNWSYLRQLG
ncbi:MAG: DUF971 domain-containing protein [Archangiaceae bacterium]|nr:DUF971 domain-containing protein [Archangiaceae bacterium]